MLNARRWLRALVLAIVYILLACGDPVTYSEVHRFDPPGFFQRGYVATLTCMGFSQEHATRRYERVEWYQSTDLAGRDGPVKGAWEPPHRILLEGGRYASPELRNHEAIHDALGGGEHDHPAFGRPDRWDGCETPTYAGPPL